MRLREENDMIDSDSDCEALVHFDYCKESGQAGRQAGRQAGSKESAAAASSDRDSSQNSGCLSRIQ